MALIGLALLAVPPAQAQAQQGPRESTAVESLGSCLLAQGAGDVLLLLDRSASLQNTDPVNARVRSASYLADSLASFAASNDVDLALSVAGFDVDFEARSGWSSVRTGDASPVLGPLADMATQNTGFETDYWMALEGARQQLRDRAEQVGAEQGSGQRCQAVVWFTDGRFELDARVTNAQRRQYGVRKPYAPDIRLDTTVDARRAEDLGRESLCRGGGLADQVRESNIKVLAVGLQNASEPENFRFLKSIATGRAGKQTCGAVQAADSGTFTLATNVNDLIFAFDSLGSPDQPPLPDERPLCDASGCPEGTHTVVLDNSVRAVRVLAGSNLETATIELRSPGASEPLILPNGQDGAQTIADVDVSWRWVSTTTVEISMTPTSPDPQGWTGAWSVTFVDPSAPDDALARTNVHVEGDLVPTVDGQPPLEWRLGDDPQQLSLGLARRGSGEDVDAESLESTVAVDAVLVLPGGAQEVLAQDVAAGDLDQPLTVDLDGAQQGSATVRLRLDVTTKPATAPGGGSIPGTALAPRTVSVPVEILPPNDYPTFAGRLDFGTTEGVGPLSRELQISGPGCVWLDGVETSSKPDGVGIVRITTESATSADTCLRVEEGEARALPLSLTVEEAGNGAVNGALTVSSVPLTDPNASLSADVSYFADLRRPVNEAVRWWVTALLTLLGSVIPLGILWLVAWWQNRIPGGTLLVAVADVDVHDGLVTRRDTGGPLDFRPDELDHVAVPPSGTRRLPLPLSDVSVTSTVANPLKPAFRVEALGRDVRTRDGGTALLSLTNAWFVLRDSTGTTFVGLLRGMSSYEERADFFAQASRELPSRVEGWAVPATTPAAASSQGWADASPSPDDEEWGGRWGGSDDRDSW